jgi:hypothetical protein
MAALAVPFEQATSIRPAPIWAAVLVAAWGRFRTEDLACISHKRTGRWSWRQTKEELDGLGRDRRVRRARVP